MTLQICAMVVVQKLTRVLGLGYGGGERVLRGHEGRKAALNCSRSQCRPMTNERPPFKGLNIRIPIIIPISGMGLLIRGLGKPCKSPCGLRQKEPHEVPARLAVHLGSHASNR